MGISLTCGSQGVKNSNTDYACEVPPENSWIRNSNEYTPTTVSITYCNICKKYLYIYGLREDWVVLSYWNEFSERYTQLINVRQNFVVIYVVFGLKYHMFESRMRLFVCLLFIPFTQYLVGLTNLMNSLGTLFMHSSRSTISTSAFISSSDVENISPSFVTPQPTTYINK